MNLADVGEIRERVLVAEWNKYNPVVREGGQGVRGRHFAVPRAGWRARLLPRGLGAAQRWRQGQLVRAYPGPVQVLGRQSMCGNDQTAGPMSLPRINRSCAGLQSRSSHLASRSGFAPGSLLRRPLHAVAGLEQLGAAAYYASTPSVGNRTAPSLRCLSLRPGLLAEGQHEYQYYPATIYENMPPKLDVPCLPMRERRIKEEYPPSSSMSSTWSGGGCGRYQGLESSRGYYPDVPAHAGY